MLCENRQNRLLELRSGSGEGRPRNRPASWRVGDTMSVVSAVNATTFALISEDGGTYRTAGGMA